MSGYFYIFKISRMVWTETFDDSEWNVRFNLSFLRSQLKEAFIESYPIQSEQIKTFPLIRNRWFFWWRIPKEVKLRYGRSK